MKTRLLQIAFLLIFCPVSPAWAQTPAASNADVEAIRQQMQQLRQDYEQRIRALEDRLQKVESVSQVS